MSSVIMQLEQSNVVIVPKSSDNNGSIIVEDILESSDDKSVPFNMKTSKWGIVKAANHRIVSRVSKGEIKLNNLLDELQKLANEEQKNARKSEQITVTNFWDFNRLCRRNLAYFLRQPIFHYIVISLVIIDLIVVLIDLVLAQLSSPCLTTEEMEQYNTTEQRDSCLLKHSVHLDHTESFLFYFSALLLTFFVLEVFLSFYAFGWKYYKNPLYLLDGIIVFASFITEIYFHYGDIGRAGRAAAALIILRLWKIIRVIHAVAHSLTAKNHSLIQKIQEAKILLEEEKEQTEQTLEKQEIKLEYFANILTKLGKLPSTSHIDSYVNNIWSQRKTPS